MTPTTDTPHGATPPEMLWLAERYEFVEELGRGGMAVVYLARERATGRDVAIKLVGRRYAEDPDAWRRFAREARTVAGLRHPNIVRTLAIEELGGNAVAIVNQYVRGDTLRAVLKRAGALPYDRALRVLRDLAAALAHAHSRRIVHRDVKPENVFLRAGTGDALLADFGIARPLDGDSALTIEGTALGTPTYMSPEQVDGRTVDERTDVYALGLVGWEMLSGRRPWQGEGLYALLHKQKHERLTPIDQLRPDIPAFLLTAIERATAKDPAERWRDGAEFLDRLLPRAAALGPTLVDEEDTDGLTVRLAPRAAPPEAARDAGDVVPAHADRAEDTDQLDLLAVDRDERRDERRDGRRDERPQHPGTASDAPPPLARPGASIRIEDEAPAAIVHLGGPSRRAVEAPAWPRRRQRPRRRWWPAAAAAAAGALALALLLPAQRRAVARSAAPPPVASGPASDASLDSLLASSSAATGRGSDSSGGDVSRTPARAGDARLPASPPAAVIAPTPAPVVPNPAPRANVIPPIAAAAAAHDARCASPTNADQKACLLAQMHRDDVGLNRDYQALISALRSVSGGREPRAVRALRDEQRAWVVERDRACRAATKAQAGLYWGAARVPCFAELSQRRAAALRMRRVRLVGG